MQSPDLASPGHGSPRSRTLTGSLVEIIRSDIAVNVFPPGSRLTEESLAERYGTSRTPVREALRALVQESLLEHVPNAGYSVTRLRLRDLDDLYAIRIAIEQRAVRRLAEGLGDLRMVEGLLAVWGSVPEQIETDVNIVFADESFHETLAAASRSPVLVEMLRSINRRLHALRMREFVDPERVRRTYDQHGAIIGSILDGDGDLAVSRMESHILEGHRFVRRASIESGIVDHDALGGDDRPGTDDA